jgi:translation elongation factor P/translation initiation factor 5A
MRLEVIDTNFLNDFDWLFKLRDEKGSYFYIMNKDFYKTHNIKSPITKNELDYLDKGFWLKCKVEEIDGRAIVVSIFR